MNGYYCGIKINEVIGYAQVPENVRDVFGDMMVAIKIGAMKNMLIVRADEIVIEE